MLIGPYIRCSVDGAASWLGDVLTRAEATWGRGMCVAENGWGMERNLVNAYRWYRKAAEDGLAYGQFNLGRCYGNGWGAAKDLSQAAFWYQRCAPLSGALSEKCCCGAASFASDTTKLKERRCRRPSR